jgi:hypothetical protein
MVDELDASIVRFIDRELPRSIHPTPITVSFATPPLQLPTDSLKPPVINFFLYSLQQNLGLRRNDPIIERQNNSVRRAPPPVLMDASYLITVWTDDKSDSATADEHRIFAGLLQVLMANSTLPAQDLGESMKNVSPPTCVVGSGLLQMPSQAWQALGGQQKLSTTFTVTFEMPVIQPEEAAIVKERRIESGLLKQGDLIEKEMTRSLPAICGTVLDREGKPVPALPVLMRDGTGTVIRRTMTRADGTYYFLDLPTGDYEVSASLLGAETRRPGAVTRNDQGDIETAIVDLELTKSHWIS